MTRRRADPKRARHSPKTGTGRFMIYGATGFTGKLVTRQAAALGLQPMLAGRNAARLKAVAEGTGLECRAVDLADGEALRRAVAEVDAVLHLAGPFSQTAGPMLEACLAARTHYLDITGEIDVFEACAARDAAARQAGITVMPGCGFDVAPSDCLAAHVKRRLPDAAALNLGIAGLGSVSRGTPRTAVENLGRGVRVRRHGRIVALPSPPRRRFDFGEGPQSAVAVGWGDVATAWHSTGIPEITVYFAVSWPIDQIAGLGEPLRWLLGSGRYSSCSSGRSAGCRKGRTRPRAHRAVRWWSPRPSMRRALPCGRGCKRPTAMRSPQSPRWRSPAAPLPARRHRVSRRRRWPSAPISFSSSRTVGARISEVRPNNSFSLVCGQAGKNLGQSLIQLNARRSSLVTSPIVRAGRVSMSTVPDETSDDPVARTRLLRRRMVAAGLAVEAIAEGEPDMFRNLQTRCANCEYADRCEKDLRDTFAASGSQGYCSNCVLLNALSETWWLRAYI